MHYKMHDPEFWKFQNTFDCKKIVFAMTNHLLMPTAVRLHILKRCQYGGWRKLVNKDLVSIVGKLRQEYYEQKKS